VERACSDLRVWIVGAIELQAVLSLAQRLVVCLSLPQGRLKCAQVHSRSSLQLVNSSKRCDALCDGQWEDVFTWVFGK
jgi:hypothetical protein